MTPEEEFALNRARELRDQSVAVCERRTRERDDANAEIKRLRRTLEFYADPETYFAIGFNADPPNGKFMDDFEEVDDMGFRSDPYNGSYKPGKRARAALAAPLKTFTAVVIETRSVKVRYTVESESLEMAKMKIEEGSTIDESEYPASLEVVDRILWEGPEEVA